MFKNKENFIAVLILLLPVLMMQSMSALGIENNVKKDEEFLIKIGAYVVPPKEKGCAVVGCRRISSEFTDTLERHHYESFQTPSEMKGTCWYFGKTGFALYSRDLEEKKNRIEKTLQEHPELVDLMSPEQQAYWQEHCNKKSRQVAQEKTLQDCFLAQ